MRILLNKKELTQLRKLCKEFAEDPGELRILKAALKALEWGAIPKPAYQLWDAIGSMKAPNGFNPLLIWLGEIWAEQVQQELKKEERMIRKASR